MKKFRLLLTAMILLVTSGLYAQIVNFTNMSAEWQRTGNRNAAIDAADIVFYNPAGLTKLSDGLHVNISNQTVIRFPEHTADYSGWGAGDGKETFSHDGIDWFLPNAYLAYKQNNWAVFTGFCIPAGGGTANYPDGSFTTEMLAAAAGLPDIADQSLEASSMYLSGILGGSYAINDMFSFSVGVRYIHAKNTIEGEITSAGAGMTLKEKMDETADGFGAVIGLNITPLPALNIGIRYETVTKLEFETNESADDLTLFTDGEKNRNDLPAAFAIGASYAVTTDLTLEADFSYYFQKQADWGKDDSGTIDYAEEAGDSYCAGIAAIYKVNPVITVSGGITYTDFMWKDEEAYYTKLGAYEVLYSDNIAFLIGGAYEVTQGVKINLAYNYTWWKSEELDYNNGVLPAISVKTKNATHVITVGADCTF